MSLLYILLCIAQILILVGALNWGLMAYHIDIVKSLFAKDYVGTAYKIIGLSVTSATEEKCLNKPSALGLL